MHPLKMTLSIDAVYVSIKCVQQTSLLEGSCTVVSGNSPQTWRMREVSALDSLGSGFRSLWFHENLEIFKILSVSKAFKKF